MKVEIPEELKKWLVDDWDLVTRQKQVCTASCTVHVCKIASFYVCEVLYCNYF